MASYFVVYPDGCAPLMKHLPPEILICRLESLVTSVNGLGKDAGGQYVRLALHLLRPWLMDHRNCQVRHLVAQCSTLLLSCYEADQIPYRSANLRTFLLFIIKELSELRNPETYTDSLDLMQMIFEQKTFLLASKQIYYDDICCHLLETLFNCFRDDNVMELICQRAVDLMSQVISGCAGVSQSLLDNIFINMIKPFKSANKTAYSVAVNLLRISKNDLESRIISFFKDELLERETESMLSSDLFPLLYEVVEIAPELLIDVLPKLKFWLQSDQVIERKEAVRFLAHTFSSISVNLVKEQSILWTYFLDRFRDVNVGIRCICVSSSVNFFVYHQELLTYSPVGPTMIDHLKSGSSDVDSRVRLEFVMSILRALKCRMEVPEDLIDCLEKRTRDKNFDVRKASVVGLSKLFKRIYTEFDTSHSDLEAGHRTPTETSSHLEAEDPIVRTGRPVEAEEFTARTGSPLEAEDPAERPSSPLEVEDLTVRTGSALEAQDIEMTAGVVDVDVRDDNEFDNVFDSEEEDLERSSLEETVDVLKISESDEQCESGKMSQSVKMGGLSKIYDAGNEDKSCAIIDLEMECFSIHIDKSTKDENDLSDRVDVAEKSDSDKNMDDLEEVENPYALVGEYDSGNQQDMEDVEEVESRYSLLLASDSNDGGNLQKVKKTDVVMEECDLEREEAFTYDLPSESEEISQQSGFSTCSTENQWIQMQKARQQMIGNAVLHGYRNQSAHDRVLVENMLYAYLIPYSLSTAERMNRLLLLYSILDDAGIRSLQELLKVQQTLRLHLRNIIEDDDVHLLTKDQRLRSESLMHQERSSHSAVQSEESEEVQTSKISEDCVKDNKVSEDINRNKKPDDQTVDQTDKELSAAAVETSEDTSVSDESLFLATMPSGLRLKINQLLKYLPQPPVTLKCLIQLVSWPEVRGYLQAFLGDDCPCHKTVQIMRTILVMCRDRRESPDLYITARILLHRTAPVLVDMEAIVHLVTYLDNAASGFVTINVLGKIAVDDLFRLLRMLSVVYSSCFQATEVYHSLLTFIATKDVRISSISLEVLANICQPWLGKLYSEIHRELTQSLMSVMKSGAPEQIKYGVRCLKACNSRYKDLAGKIVQHHLTNNWTTHCPLLPTALSAIRQAVKVLGHSVTSILKQQVVATVVNELLTSDIRTSPATKIEGMKLVVVVFLFGCDFDRVLPEYFLSTLEMLLELDEEDTGSRMSVKKRIALQAGCCMINLAKNQLFDELITFDQFHNLAFLFNDSCDIVHQVLLHKLHKGLWTRSLSVRYLAVLSLVALSRSTIACERIPAVSHILQRNIECCRTYVNNLAEEHYRKLPYVLADYSIVYAVHLLAHDPNLASHQDNATLKVHKKCLKFLMKPLLSGIHPSSFQFHKKLLQKVKCSKDAEHPQDKLTNQKLYAVTDVALMVLQEEQSRIQRMQRKTALASILPEKLLKQMMLEPRLPAKLFLVQDKKETQLSSSEAESLDSGLTFEVRSPDLDGRRSVEINVQPEKEQQEVEGAQDRVIQESAAKRRKISDSVSGKTSAKITDYFEIINRSRESAVQSGGLLKESVCYQGNTETPQVPRQQKNRGGNDAVKSRVLVFEREHSNTEDSEDNDCKGGASDDSILI